MAHILTAIDLSDIEKLEQDIVLDTWVEQKDLKLGNTAHMKNEIAVQAYTDKRSDIAHTNALTFIKITEYSLFLSYKHIDRKGCIVGENKVGLLADKEQCKNKRKTPGGTAQDNTMYMILFHYLQCILSNAETDTDILMAVMQNLMLTALKRSYHKEAGIYCPNTITATSNYLWLLKSLLRYTRSNFLHQPPSLFPSTSVMRVRW